MQQTPVQWQNIIFQYHKVHSFYGQSYIVYFSNYVGVTFDVEALVEPGIASSGLFINYQFFVEGGVNFLMIKNVNFLLI